MRNFTQKIGLRLTLAFGAAMGVVAHAMPAFDHPVGDNDGSEVLMYFDADPSQKVIWYAPKAILPLTTGSLKSTVVRTKKSLLISYRGQPSISQESMDQILDKYKVSAYTLVPMPMESVGKLECCDMHSDNVKVQSIFPPKIGAFNEIVPISVRYDALNADGLEELDALQGAIEGSGLTCFSSISHRGTATAYKLVLSANLSQVFSQFEADAHASGLWWEADIHTKLMSMNGTSGFTLTDISDPAAPKAASRDDLISAADKIVSMVQGQIFSPATDWKPDPTTVNSGKAFRLKADYQRNSTNKSYSVNIESSSVRVQDSTIAVILK